MSLYQQGGTWAQMAEELKHHFPQLTILQTRDKVRDFIRTRPEYKKTQAQPPQQSSVEYKADGTIISEKFITCRDGQEMTPEFILTAHGLKAELWEMVSYKHNTWNSQLKGGILQISFQSKLTAKPRQNAVTFTDIENYFKNKDFGVGIKKTEALRYDPNGEILEICLPDLHNGLLAWRKETGKDYDIQIAKEHFYQCLYDITNRCENKRLKKIVFVTLGDLMHIDNDMQTTTKGTFQQSDGRTAKIFDATLDMLVDGITILGDIAPVDVIYLAGNHDRTTGYMVIKAAEQAFRKDDNITFDTAPNPQKFKLMGNVLIGWTHGDMQKQNMSGWLQQTARREYGQSKFAEVHAGHYHSLKTIETKRDMTQTDDAGGIVIRYLPTICNASYWEHQQGYGSAVKALMAFVWNEVNGLREMWQSNIV
jgi:hypothetical protein